MNTRLSDGSQAFVREEVMVFMADTAYKETMRAREAFEYYYLLGFERDLMSVSLKFKVSLKTVEKWADKYSWVERAKQRDARNMEMVAEADDKAFMDSLRDNLKVVNDSIARYVQSLADGEVVIKTVKDYDKLARLSMDLNERLEEKNKAHLMADKQQDTNAGVLSIIGNIRAEIQVASTNKEDGSNDTFASVDDVLDQGDD